MVENVQLSIMSSNFRNKIEKNFPLVLPVVLSESDRLFSETLVFLSRLLLQNLKSIQSYKKTFFKNCKTIQKFLWKIQNLVKFQFCKYHEVSARKRVYAYICFNFFVLSNKLAFSKCFFHSPIQLGKLYPKLDL